MRTTLTLLALGCLLVGCAGQGARSPSAAPAASPSPVPSSAAVASSDGVGRIVAGPLEAGRYASLAFRPPLSFTLGDGWSGLFPDEDGELALEHASRAFLGFDRVDRVVDGVAHTAVEAPDDLVGWFLGHPELEAEAGEPIEVAGLAGSWVDARASDEEVEVFAYPGGNWRMPKGTAARFFVLPMDGPDLVIVVAASLTGIDEAVARVEPILDSVELSVTSP